MDLSAEGWEALAKLALQAAQARDGWMLVALALVFVVFLARRFLAPRVPWFATQAGGAVLSLVTAFAGALATAVLSGTGVTPVTFLAALKVAFVASGGWTLVKHLLSAFKAPAAAEIITGAEKAAADAPKPVQSVEDIVNGGGQ